MKRKGDCSEFKEHRENELTAAYRRQLKRGPAPSVTSIYENMVMEPAARFWVGERRAAMVVGRMLKGDAPAMAGKKREMYEEIFRRVEKTLADRPGMSVMEAVTYAVNSPAPEFYMAPETARKHLRLILRRNRLRRGGGGDE